MSSSRSWLKPSIGQQCRQCRTGCASLLRDSARSNNFEVNAYMLVPAWVIQMGLIGCLALPAIAQENMPPESVRSQNGAKVLGTVVRGNTTIIFEAAGTRGIDSNKLSMWDQFAEEHPKIASTLAYKPSLISDSSYLTKHPEL